MTLLDSNFGKRVYNMEMGRCGIREISGVVSNPALFKLILLENVSEAKSVRFLVNGIALASSEQGTSLFATLQGKEKRTKKPAIV